jgi:hypothetical protein
VGVTTWFFERLTVENLREWQSLVAGLLAICAAVIGGLFVWGQSRATARHNREIRRAKFQSARAVLPLVLSELTAWVSQTIFDLKRFYSGVEKPELEAHTWPEISENLISQLREVIEFSANNDLDLYIIDIIQQIQIVRSRMSHLRTRERNRARNGMQLDDHIFDLLMLSAWLDGLFHYARSGSEICPKNPVLERLDSQLFHYGLDADSKFENVRIKIAEWVKLEQEVKALDKGSWRKVVSLSRKLQFWRTRQSIEDMV